MVAIPPPPLRLGQFSYGSDRFLLSARLQMTSLCTYDHLLRALHCSLSPIHWCVASSCTSAIDRLLHALHFSPAAPIASFSVPACKWPPSAPPITSSVTFMARRSPSNATSPWLIIPILWQVASSAPAPSIASSMLRTSPAAPIASFLELAYKWPPSAPPITSFVTFMACRSPSKRNSAFARHPRSIGKSPPMAPGHRSPPPCSALLLRLRSLPSRCPLANVLLLPF